MMEIPAKMSTAETSTSKTTELCQPQIDAFVKGFSEMSKISSTRLYSRNAQSHRSCQNCRRHIHSALQILFPSTNDASSNSACDSVIPSCVGDDHLNPKVRHGPQGTEDWSEQHRCLGRGPRTPERRSLGDPVTGMGRLRRMGGNE